LHRRFGFELMGTLRSVGFKSGRWVDTPILQRGLGSVLRQASDYDVG
jgi:L-amino acid N-acyltransferase YncA